MGSAIFDFSFSISFFHVLVNSGVISDNLSTFLSALPLWRYGAPVSTRPFQGRAAVRGLLAALKKQVI
jgi:hypothetical protein